jgi:hypothetical protein
LADSPSGRDLVFVKGITPSSETSPTQQQAGALALLAETALHHGIDPGTPGERYQVVVHVVAEVLADAEAPGQSVLEGGTRVSAETSRRLACDATRTATSWKSARARERFRWRSGARCTTATTAAGSRAAACRSGKAITSATGPRAAPRRSRTSRCSVAAITAPSTRRDTRWNACPTESCGSADQVERLPDVPFPSAIPNDPVQALRARNEAAGLHLHARTACPGWLWERLDVGWAIDVLHPRALKPLATGE